MAASNSIKIPIRDVVKRITLKTGMIPKLTIHATYDRLIMHLHDDVGQDYFDVRLVRGKNIRLQEVIFNWLMLKIKRLWKQMPIEQDVLVHCDKKTYAEHKESIQWLAMTLSNTNKAIKDFKELKAIGEKYNNILFFNVNEDIRYGDFYRYLFDSEQTIFYQNLQLGFDREKREWNDSEIPMSIQDLIEYLVYNKIGKIVTVNHYLTDKYIEKTGINLIALFRFLGMEIIIIDNDPPDLRVQGYLHKSAFCDIKNRRFGNLYVLNKYWDEKSLMMPEYVAIPQNYGDVPSVQKLNTNYKIVVLSNSRLNAIKPMQGVIEAILDSFASKDRWIEIQIWYMAMRHMVLREMELAEFERLYYNSMLHNFYFNAVNYIKWEVVKSISTNHEVLVYGDIGWNEICPKYYSGCLDNDEVKSLYSKKNMLFLLLNASLSYLDASGPVYDMVRRNVPWCNLSPMIRIEKFEPLIGLEYSNRSDLNVLINDPGFFYTDQIRYGIEALRELYLDSTRNLKLSIINDESRISEYMRSLMDHDEMLIIAIEKYINEKRPFLIESFRLFDLCKLESSDIES